MKETTLQSTTGLPVPNESDTIRKYITAATSDNTRKTYRSAIKQFEKWGGRLPSDPQTLIQYLLARAQASSIRTLDLHLTAIGQWHRYQGMENPVDAPLVRKAMEGIRRTHGQPKRKAKALRLEHIGQMVGHLQQQPNSNKRARDLALVLSGFFGAFRRSELVAIDIDDLLWEPEGLIVRMPHSKTDQESAGQMRALPYGNKGVCPAAAIKSWINIANIESGPLFRPINRWDQIKQRRLGAGAINDLLKALGANCGFDFVPDLSSHSLRRGLSTSAARERVDFELIKKQGGWKSDATVWEYIEEGQLLTNNATLVLMEKLALHMRNA
ncbi:site-specific integrase [Saccharophagus degradans]|uniref:Phage integrase n=1 Tax=Saccharophagus degradans (strain 2-40 / ATCC 43961 / DSM 17024) TaxID=203122 RepID=Q21JA7_SACD2|nr:site-specific integrase [Saccharophagus degradans]ABD81222.1 phage integrase [Saccharophagus degradans 2-40]